jgi:hypothetical protein
MQFGLLEEAVRLSILAAIPSIMASTALIAIIACRQKITEYAAANGGSKLAHDVHGQFPSDIIIPALFAIAELSLTSTAIVFGLVEHLVLH